jgi:hypothetical protein
MGGLTDKSRTLHRLDTEFTVLLAFGVLEDVEVGHYRCVVL